MHRTISEQALVFFSLAIWSYNTLHEAIGECLAEDDIMTGVETIGTWAWTFQELIGPDHVYLTSIW